MTAKDEARPVMAAGGCQCGAVRYAIRGAIVDCTLCHCRMCQKASGGPFMTFVGLAAGQVAWTKGAPSLFGSSSFATRGFCRDCGTPLTYQYKPSRLSLTHGSLDDPSIVSPTKRLSSETVLPWCEAIGALPIQSLADWAAARGPEAAPIVSRQHPDGP